jgi:hypothetical protein
MSLRSHVLQLLAAIGAGVLLAAILIVLAPSL